MLTPDPKKFPEPHMWATWITGRHPQFKTHPSASTCKVAISAKSQRDGTVGYDSYVYRWDNEGAVWAQVAHIPQGGQKMDHEFFMVKQGRTVSGPTTKAVDAAIASIMNAKD